MSIAAERDDIGEIAEALRAAKRVVRSATRIPTPTPSVRRSLSASLLSAWVRRPRLSVPTASPMFDFLPHVGQVVRKPPGAGSRHLLRRGHAWAVRRIASEKAGWLSRATMLNIDHHVSSNYFGDLNLVDPKAAATCEVVARVVDALEIELDESWRPP